TGQIAAFDPSAIAAGTPVVRNAGVNSPGVLSPSADVAVPASIPIVPGPGEDAEPRDVATSVPSEPPTTEAVVTLPHVSTVAWAGDSVAYDIAPAVRAALTAGGWVVDDLAAYPGFMLTNSDEKVSL